MPYPVAVGFKLGNTGQRACVVTEEVAFGFTEVAVGAGVAFKRCAGRFDAGMDVHLYRVVFIEPAKTR